MRHRPFTVALAGATGAMCVTLGSFSLTGPAEASTPLTSVVSQTPVAWTPNVSAGPTVGDETYCNTTFFGAQYKNGCQSEVYSTAYVNGDVVVSGAFTEVCEPGTLAQGLCARGTQVVRDDIFAYAAGTGVIDRNFKPVLNAGPAWSVLAGQPGSNTVYVGGQFSTVDGSSHHGLVELNVNPGVTSGPDADGSIVTRFTGYVNYEARHLALSPEGSALYVSGQFTAVDGVSTFADRTKVSDLARLNATTGALDSSFAFGVGGAVGSSTPVEVWAMALSPDGTHLAFSGGFLTVNGQSRPRLAIVDTGTILGSPSSLSDWTAPILKNNCSLQHDYVRGLDFSPDGTFIATADTGLDSDGSTPYSACDAVARYNVDAANTTSTGTAVDVPPAWIDYGGGDSFYSVAIAGGVVYAGGHDRWVNNYCGNNYVCGPNAVLVAGLSALDANTGIALAWWHPLTLRGDGTMYLSTFPAGTYDGSSAGLALGTDVDNIAGAYHSEEAIFPTAAATSSHPGGPVPSGMFNEEGGSDLANPMCMDDVGDSSSSGAPVALDTCTNDAEQNWSVVGETVQINGLCLDTAKGGTGNGTPVVLSTCTTGAATEQWTQGGGNSLKNGGAPGYCLTAPSAGAGTQLQIEPCDGATSQVWPLPAAQGPPPPPPTGEISSREIQTRNFQVPCLDDAGNSTARGNKVQLWTCTGDSQQKWTVSTGSTFTIGIDGSYCLDSSNSGKKGALPAVLNPCNGSPSQEWTAPAIDGNNRQLRNTGASALNGSPYCLVDPDPNGGSPNGTAVEISTCDTSSSITFDAHAWRLPAD